MRQQREPSPSQSLFWPVVLAVALHTLMFAMLFVSFAFAPDLPPARPIVQATLYQLKSQSQATTQTSQKIAGEAKKTAAPQYETEQLEQKKAEEQKLAQAEQQKLAQAEAQKQAAAKAAEQKKAEAARKAEAQKKAAEQKKLADIAKKKAADEAAKKKAVEDAKKKDAEKKAAAEAAKKKAAEQARRKAVEDKKAAALAELLSEDVGHQQALADEVGDQVAGNLDDLIIKLISENWRKPMSARSGMSVELLIEMLPDGTISNASVRRSSGDSPFDASAVAAVRSVGRIPEMQQLDRATFDSRYRQRRVIFKPEDLGL